ncbi:MAG: FlgD immunoglobulin-like domain containing protein [candidate division WOR-3 bacterium]
MKRVMFMNPGEWGSGNIGYVPIGDFDLDRFLEMAYYTGRWDSMTTNPQRWEIIKFLPFNRWQLLYSDTAVGPPVPPGFQPGFFHPGDFADNDRDGLIELLGHDFKFIPSNCSIVLCTKEARYSGELPITMSWYVVTGGGGPDPTSAYCPGSLDSDSLSDILHDFHTEVRPYAMLENSGNNAYRQAWIAPMSVSHSELTFGDYDSDQRAEFVGAYSNWTGQILVWETVGDDSYANVWQDSVHLPNSACDIWSGRDVNRNGKPEFFVSPARCLNGGDQWMCYLIMWESDGTQGYERTMIDSVWRGGIPGPDGRSICADVDADGVEEIVWSTNRAVDVYKHVSGDRFERIYEWWNDHRVGSYPDGANVNAADVNYDGYNEIVIGGDRKTSILEVEAVRLLSPNGGERLQPGDTCRVSWRIFDPPRCDSISLFLRRDSTYRLDTIATGLTPADTPYRWIVPNVQDDSCWLMAMAYGPGRQYDESDRPFAILGSGIAEEPGFMPPAVWFDAKPNPARDHVAVSVTTARVEPLTLSVYDYTGAKVRTLAAGALKSGTGEFRWNCTDDLGRRLPPGIYFLRLDCPGNTKLKKLVLTGSPK